MSSVTIRLIGFEEAIAGLDQWGDDVRKAFVHALEDVKDQVVEELEVRAPYLTGEMKRRISASMVNPYSATPGLRIRSLAPHSWLVEHGHQGPQPAPPHPWFVPVVVRARKRFNDRARELLAQPAPALGPGRPTIVSVAGGTGI